MIEDYWFVYLLVCLKILGTLLVGTDVEVLISNSEKCFESYLFKKNFYIYYNILQ